MATTDRDGGHQSAPPPMLTVAAVARRLGVAPSTLRTWDRRYDLGPSAHTAGSHRRYAPQDLERLVVMRRLTLEGVPPAEAARIALAAPAQGGGHSAVAHHDAPSDGSLGFEVPSWSLPGVSTGGHGHAQPDGGERVDHRDGWVDTGDERADETVAERTGTPGDPGATSPSSTGAGPAGATPSLEPRRPAPIPAARAGRVGGIDPALWHQDSTLRDETTSTWPASGPRPHPTRPLRSGGGRVVALPDGSPAARGLARAAMSLDSGEVHRLFGDAVKAYGVLAAWETMAMPVLQSIGERWRVTGDGVDVEHAFSEALVAVLHGVTATLRRPRNARSVVLTCAEGDYHTLPLHALAAALAQEGIGVRLLGVGMPASALVAAVRRTGPATVFLYARLPVTDVQVLDLLPRQRPAPRVVVGGPGWNGHQLPPQVAVTHALADAVERVVETVEP